MPRVDFLNFEPVQLNDYDRIHPYTSAFGEGSCQHSPVSMWSLSEKYGDAVCIRDGFLYTLRTHLEDQDFRVYLAPLGSGDLPGAFRHILEDARAYGKRAKFLTLTETAANLLRSAFPGRFEITGDRDLAEYMCPVETIASFPGGAMERKRTEVHAFRRAWGSRAAVTPIRPEDIAEILAFEQIWVAQNEETHDRDALRREARMIERQLRNFTALHLTGIVLRLDGTVHGFAYGTPLSSRFYDAIVEKGDKRIPHIYRVLRMESGRQSAKGCEYFNLEEDLGIPGLRAMKIAYQPEYLLKKFIAEERKAT